jgi:hypothetical protein
MATKPAPPKPAATISDIKPQARQIQQAVANLQAVLLGVELVEHFKQHPDVVQGHPGADRYKPIAAIGTERAGRGIE